MKKLKEIPEKFIPILLDVLVRTDTLWLPFRHFRFADFRAGMAVIQHRRQYRATGLPLVYGGGDADRKSGSRLVAAAKRAGLLEVCGRGKGRGVRLTRFADDYMRSITPTKRLDESWGILARVEAARATMAGDNAGCTLEFDIVGGGPDQQAQLHALADDACPLLAWGLLEAHSDTVGRIGYSVTDSGLEAIAAGPMPPPAYVPEYRSDLVDEFIAADAAAVADRATWLPDDRTEVWIPLSAGLWPESASTEGTADASH